MKLHKTFIQEPITVEWDEPPLFSKLPDCPDRFIWNDEIFTIIDLLSAWTDFERRGRMRTNMRPDHSQRASSKGSWGVGKFYFQVETEGGRIFEIYYDREPVDAHTPDSGWFLYTELRTSEDADD